MKLSITLRIRLLLAVASSLAVVAFSPSALSLGTHDELIRALRMGDYQAISEHLEAMPEPDHILPDGSTLLGWAVDSQNREVVRMLLDAGADPNEGFNPAAAPLLLACELGDGDSAITGLLLDAGADVNTKRPDGISALAICSGRAPIDIVQRMIDLGADVKHADRPGQTALMWAAAAGRVDVIDLLISNGAQVNRETEKGFTPLFFSLKSGNPLASTTLLDAGADPYHRASDGTSAVQLAMYQQAHDFVALILERGGIDLAEFDQNGNQLLHAAVLARNAELVEQLIAAGADVNTETAPSEVKWRYERNYRPDDYIVAMKSPLLLAAELGAVEIMNILLEAGADAEYRTSDGMNIVQAAEASGSEQALARALQASSLSSSL